MAKTPAKKSATKTTPAKSSPGKKSNSGTPSGFRPITFAPREEAVASLGFKTVPTGQYEVQLDGWEYRVSSAKQIPGVQFKVSILNAEDEDHNGARPWSWASLDSSFFTEALLAFLPPEVWAELEGTELDVSEITGGTWGPLNDAVGNTAQAFVTLEKGTKGAPDRCSVKNYILADDAEEDEDSDDTEDEEDEEDSDEDTEEDTDDEEEDED